MADALDFSGLDLAPLAEQGSVMEVRHPESGDVLLRDGKPVTFTLAGEDSPQYRKATHAAQDRRFKRGNLSKLRSDDLENDMADTLAACTLAWEGVVLDGEALVCNRQNALLMYRRFRWLADQVIEFIKDRSNFFQKPSTDSPPTSGIKLV